MKFVKVLFIKIPYFILVSLLIGVNLFIINAKMLGDPIPMPFGYGGAIVLSGSMEPKLMVDDLVIIQEQDKYEQGDIVVYINEFGEPISHEVINTDGYNYITAGCVTGTLDDPITIEQIKGKVIYSIPKMKGIVNFVQSPAGIFIIFISAFGILELSYLIKRINHNRIVKSMDSELHSMKKY